MSSHPGVTSVMLSNTGTAAQRGRGTLSIQHDKSGFLWRIHQMAISCVPPGQMTLETLFNDFPLLSPVTVYSGTCADGPPPVDIGDHDEIKVNVTFGPPGSNVILSYYYEEIPAS